MTAAAVVGVIPLVMTATPLSASTSPVFVIAGRATGFEGLGYGVDHAQANAGSLTVSTERSFEGAQAVKATVGGGVSNAYARVLYEGDWQQGQRVAYRMAVFLPHGFLGNMTEQHDLIRFDNFPDMPSGTERTGVSIFRQDGKVRLVRQKLGAEQIELVAPVAIEEGRWNVIEVRQLLHAQDGVASNELRLNGELVGASSLANSYGNRYQRVRYGLVAVGARQVAAQSLWFDEVILLHD